MNRYDPGRGIKASKSVGRSEVWSGQMGNTTAEDAVSVKKRVHVSSFPGLTALASSRLEY